MSRKGPFPTDSAAASTVSRWPYDALTISNEITKIQRVDD